jgi:hypothetical protein
LCAKSQILSILMRDQVSSTSQLLPPLATGMSDIKEPDSERGRGRQPRILAVVDDSVQGWRSLAWAVGYAGTRGLTSIEVVAFLRTWERLRNAAQVSSLCCPDLPHIDYEAAQREVAATARGICLDGGIEPRIRRKAIGSSHELIRTIRREPPDFVVVNRDSGLSWLGLKRAVSGLTRSGIPVIVIP